MTAPWILDFLNRRAEVEEEMLETVKTTGLATSDKLLDWALRLGVPEDEDFGRVGTEWRRIGCNCPVIHQPPCSAAVNTAAAQPTDLRALLQEARDEIASWAGDAGPTDLAEMVPLVARIDTALATPAPGPVAWIIEHDTPSNHPEEPPEHYRGVTLTDPQSHEGAYYGDETITPLYTAPPPASPSDARDAASMTNAEIALMMVGFARGSGSKDYLAAKEIVDGACKQLGKVAIEREGG